MDFWLNWNGALSVPLALPRFQNCRDTRTFSGVTSRGLKKPLVVVWRQTGRGKLCLWPSLPFQLPSMNALINKTSSQAFFLRVLKVIIQLREAALLSIMRAKQSRADKEKKEKAAAALQAAVSTADALTASASTPVAQGSETTSDQTSHPTQGKHSFIYHRQQR